ncbi:hypothetical protein N8D74_06615 [Curtobacterium flaccumfaciens]|uniref:Transposase n=1 Tax=Curtobacterium poinsettiae TaxID=159612 RepID=A0A9Q9P966_9MICO|nr:hypothetical protein [Curtobacterium flaccumfaciens]UXN26547.1 hypothetical protein N8D74_06615 [Curtobacterium flaccumfaciens]UYC81389.1 hypothetical protein OE229_02700 [Curtobacterium flaccumfaciens pv. poinsettiae]
MLHRNPNDPSPINGRTPDEQNPLDAHGPGLTGSKHLIPHSRIVMIDALLHRAGIPQKFEEHHNRERKTGSGRPRLLSDAAALTLFCAAAVEGLPMYASVVAEILFERLEPASRDLLQLTDEPTLAQCYDRVQHSIGRMLTPIDPKPAKYHRRMTKEEQQQNEARRAEDASVLAEKQTELEWLCNQLICAPVLADPSILDGWEGNVTMDATAIAVYSKRGHSRSYASIETDAAWYRRDQNHEVPTDDKKARIAFFGYEMHLVTPADNTPRISNAGQNKTKDFCRPILGISWTRPSFEPPAYGLKALTNMFSRYEQYMRGGLVIADRGYFANAKPETLQLPVRALGMGIVTDYRDDQLGIHGDHAGALQIEGAFYCPAMPKALIEATIDSREKRIDEETRLKRIDRRALYLFRRKEKPDADGYTPMMCPAAGPNATVTCAHKPKDAERNASKDLWEIPNPVSHPGQVCNQHSVVFPPTAGAKFLQDLRFGTEAWDLLYSRARNFIESTNAFIKDEGLIALGVAGRRRLRGHSKQFLIASMLIFAANLRRINTYKWEQVNIIEPPKTRRRDRLDDYRWTPPARKEEATTFIAGGYQLIEETIINNNEAPHA